MRYSPGTLREVVLTSFISLAPAPRVLRTNSAGRCLALSPQICTDIRLLANLKEMEEPFEKQQIGECSVKT